MNNFTYVRNINAREAAFNRVISLFSEEYDATIALSPDLVLSRFLDRITEAYDIVPKSKKEDDSENLDAFVDFLKDTSEKLQNRLIPMRFIGNDFPCTLENFKKIVLLIEDEKLCDFAQKEIDILCHGLSNKVNNLVSSRKSNIMGYLLIGGIAGFIFNIIFDLHYDIEIDLFMMVPWMFGGAACGLCVGGIISRLNN